MVLSLQGMKIFIDSTIRQEAWGGGNQFLKALGRELEERGVLASSRTDASAILFNSYQDIPSLIRTRITSPRTRCVWRLGPEFSIHRPGIKWKIVDFLTVFLASMVAHGVIFQSQWSYSRARRLGFFKRKNVFTIGNATDPSIFFKPEEKITTGNRTRLIYTSWSKNVNKGFSYLRFLDSHLDFTKYQMVFIGNSPVSFKNIEMCSALPSEMLADKLRGSDIFVSPTKDDACSNAILEALACGLPVVALHSGGNPELVKEGGMLFSNEEEMIRAIETVAGDINGFRGRIAVKSIGEIADEYLFAIRASIK